MFNNLHMIQIFTAQTGVISHFFPLFPEAAVLNCNAWVGDTLSVLLSSRINV